MDFHDTPAEAAFRVEARRFLEAHAKERNPASDTITPIFDERPDADERAWAESCQAWQRTKHEHGFAGLAYPVSWGGAGRTRRDDLIFAEEEARFDVPTGALTITLGMIAPTVATHGTDQQREHVRAMLSGEEIWCQLFSEPGAGSDLAAVATRATADGTSWRISGQKVWTSGAHLAGWGYLLARTGADGSKHAGLTAFVVPMDASGIDARPLRQMTGGASFNEVFFDGVLVSDNARLGAVGEGWRVALTTLMNERFSASAVSLDDPGVEAVIALASTRGRDDDPLVRVRIADLYVRREVQRYTSYRALTAIANDEVPGPEGSISKLIMVRLLKDIADLAADIGGMDHTLDGPWAAFLLGAPGMRIAGGTDEIMRNVLAERVLGLPKDRIGPVE